MFLCEANSVLKVFEKKLVNSAMRECVLLLFVRNPTSPAPTVLGTVSETVPERNRVEATRTLLVQELLCTTVFAALSAPTAHHDWGPLQATQCRPESTRKGLRPHCSPLGPAAVAGLWWCGVCWGAEGEA